MEKSLQAARDKAVSRSDRFLLAATELLSETGRTDFTVQELVERSKMSLRSFYQHFGSKDDLLLALFEGLLNEGVEAWRAEALGKACAEDRLESVVLSLYGAVASLESGGPTMSRALTLYHLQLADTRPEDFSAVLAPQLALIREIVDQGVADGEFRSDMTPNQLAVMVMQTLVAAAHMHALGSYLTGEPMPGGAVWTFIRGGVLASAR